MRTGALLDHSRSMLELVKRALVEGGVRDKITVKPGDAARLADVPAARAYIASGKGRPYWLARMFSRKDL